MGLNVARPLIVVAIVIAALFGAMRVGAKLERAKIEARSAEVIATLEAELSAVSKAAMKASAELEAARATRAFIEETLTNEAIQDPEADRISLGISSVRRLNRAR